MRRPASLPFALLLAAGLGALAVVVVLFAPRAAGAEDGVRFVGDDLPLATVLAQARQGDRLVMASLHTRSCPWCKVLERETLTAPRVAEALGDAVCVRYDAERGPGAVLAERFLVRAYPTVLFLDPAGEEVDRLVGFLAPEGFAREAARIRAGEGTLPALRRAHEGEPSAAGPAVAYARKLLGAGRLAAARDLLEPLLRAEPPDPDALLARAEVALEVPDVERALADLARLVAQRPGTPQAATARVRRVRILAHEGRVDEALAECASAREVVREAGEVADLEGLAHGLHRAHMHRALLRWGEAAWAAQDADALLAAAQAAQEDGVAMGSALRWAERAAVLRARAPEALERVAALQEATGSLERALTTTREALGTGAREDLEARLRARERALLDAIEARRRPSPAAPLPPPDAPAPRAPCPSTPAR